MINDRQDEVLTNKDQEVLGLGIVSIAFSLSIFFYGGPTSFYLLLAALFLLLMVLYRVTGFIDAKGFYWSKVHTVIALYAIFLFSNIFTSVFPENSIGIAILLLSMPMVVLVLGFLSDKKWQRLLIFIAIPGLFTAAWGLFEFILTGERSNGPIIDPNSFASLLNCFYFLLLSHYLLKDHRFSFAVLFALCFVSMAIFAAYSRVGNFNFFAALMVVSAIALFAPLLRRKIALVVFSAVLGFTLIHSIHDPAAVSHDEGYTLDVESDGWSLRLIQWQSGLAQAKDYPLLGSGLGTFKVLYPRYRTLGDSVTAGNFLHNDYIQLLAEAGPLMLLFVMAFLSFLVFMLWRSMRIFFVSRQAKDIEAIVLIVAMATVFVHALMNFTLYNLPNQILLGVALVRLMSITALGAETSIQIRSPRLLKSGLAVMVGYFIFVNSLDFVSADLAYRGGIVPIKRNDAVEELARYDAIATIRNIRPQVAANRFAMATFFRANFDQTDPGDVDARRALSIVAALEYQAGLEINPYHSKVREYFSTFLLQNPDLSLEPEIYQTPEALLRQGLELAPCYVARYLSLVELLENTERSDEAYQLMLDGALPWSEVRYEDYELHQIKLFKKIFREASARQDTAALRRLLMQL